MSFAWSFKEATPGDRARESQVEKFFKSDAVKDRADAVVREGIQNSLDASPSGQPIRVRITLGQWTPAEAEERLPLYESGFREHIDEESVAAKIANLPELGDSFRYLVFEDFGTTGLHGDPREWWPDEHGDAGAFFKYFRAEGISGKGDGARGRHGVGRLVFMFASRARTMYGLTRREDPTQGTEELLMGTSVLCNHRLGGQPYLPDGWFGEPDPSVPGLILPIRDDALLERFKSDFNISRCEENGLSVVVPWLSDDVTFDAVVRAALAEYYHPILAGGLSVEVTDGESEVLIDAATIEEQMNAQGAAFSGYYLPFLELARRALSADDWIQLDPPGEGSPKWFKGVISEQLAEQIHFRLDEDGGLSLEVPVEVRSNTKPAAESKFRLVLQREPGLGDSQVHFVREGILVTDVRPKRTNGFRALVVIDRGPLGQFLGDSENPSHTQWHKDVVKNSYVFAAGLLDYVVNCVHGLMVELSRQQEKADTALLLDLFALPADTGPRRKVEEKKPIDGTKTEPPHPDVPARPRTYSVTRHGTGFSVRRGSLDAKPPPLLSIRIAYDVRRGNPFSKYRPSDFEFGKAEVVAEAAGCEIVHLGPNSALVRILSDEFEFNAYGFDVERRDLLVDVRVPKVGSSDVLEGLA